MGATSYRERHALQLHQRLNADLERDPFDRDDDPTEVPHVVVNQWHESQRQAVPPSFTTIPAEVIRQRLAEAKAAIKPAVVPQHVKRAMQLRGCWHDVPAGLRKTIARAAGLPSDVVDKLDRDLTESEKCHIRTAAKRLRDIAEGLTHL